MSEHEGDGDRAVYDHEVDARPTGRRRTVADWGVGEELFDRMPRRRFRPSDANRRDAHRRFEPAEPREHVSERDDTRGRGDAPRRPPAPDAARRPPADDDVRRPPARDDLRRWPANDDARRPPARADVRVRPARDDVRTPVHDDPRQPPANDDGPAATAPVEPPAPSAPVAPDAPPIVDHVAPPSAGRRTVVIRGHGAEPAWTPRRRPPRTVGERIGPRPDRLAAWAVALGMLLILIAILTAHG